MRYHIIRYDTIKHDFVRLIRNLLGVSNLEDLDEKHDELFKVGADSCTSFHQKFYGKYHDGWWEMECLYEDFIRDVMIPIWKPPFLYQKFPTFRVHLRGNLAVGAFHNDAQFGHPTGEMNYIIPLTNSSGTASVWVESEPGKEDYQPMELRVGNLIEFNGNVLTHGNKLNDTGKTRVSMDYRILPMAYYRPHDFKATMTRKTPLLEGEYYKRME